MLRATFAVPNSKYFFRYEICELTPPAFLVAHLSRYSVSTLTTEIYAPEDLVYNYEHTIGFNLGFGPPLDLNVCTFTPRDKKLLRSYQKCEGKAKLHVQESLPLVLNMFSIESQAEELDIWLDGIIDSECGLYEYVALIRVQQKDNYSSQVLKALISWYMASKNDVGLLFVVFTIEFGFYLSAKLNRC